MQDGIAIPTLQILSDAAAHTNAQSRWILPQMETSKKYPLVSHLAIPLRRILKSSHLPGVREACNYLFAGVHAERVTTRVDPNTGSYELHAY